MWDAALRVRNLFLRTPLPDDLAAALGDALAQTFADAAAVVVRSSAPGEDGAAASFAGLHESYVNVIGREAILEHVKLVWASLWSDAAILYRRELGLDPRESTMAVVVQEIVAGERSGVAFSVSPVDPARAVVEAVHGLNQGLVDGTVEPDHWELTRADGAVLEHRPVVRREMTAPGAEGVRLVALPEGLRHRPPLAEAEVGRVWSLARAAEALFGAPQDVEWTWRGDALFTLQSRPVTTGAGGERADDGRAVYLSLRRSFDTLVRLRESIESESLPAMAAEAAAMAANAVGGLDDNGLRHEAERRRAAHARWVGVYERDFIPFAHGARLFGQAYNDAVRPADPFEFVTVLQAQPMESLRRNRALERLAAVLRDDPDGETGPGFARSLDAFVTEFGATTWGTATLGEQRELIVRLAGRLAASRREGEAAASAEALAAAFLDRFDGDERAFAEGLLDLGRASYRLRDDDNLYLGAVTAQVVLAEEELRRRGLVAVDEPIRLAGPSMPSPLAPPPAGGPPPASSGGEPSPGSSDDAPEIPLDARLQVRQIVGQPAGPGIAVGSARVVREVGDLAGFEAGEILVCDAIDPNMTFVVPLAAGIVERRGGMLIHGAIIAREYGLACVTGVPRATEVIATGERVTVDGFLGIVIVG